MINQPPLQEQDDKTKESDQELFSECTNKFWDTNRIIESFNATIGRLLVKSNYIARLAEIN